MTQIENDSSADEQQNKPPEVEVTLNYERDNNGDRPQQPQQPEPQPPQQPLPPTPHHPILLPNISTFSVPQMDKTFPERLSGYVSREEHEEFLEQVNEELQKLTAEDGSTKEMERWGWPIKGFGLLLVVGGLILGVGVVTENEMLGSLGMVIVVLSTLVLFPLCCYLIYLAYVQDTESEEVVATVAEMSLEKFYPR